MATTVPMLAPDGTSGEIPQDKVQAAQAAGFKKVVPMTSPDGKNGWIPEDRVPDATKAGFKMAAPATPPDTRNGFQRAVDDASTVTPADEAGHSWLANQAQKVGAGVIGGILGPVAHPIQALKSIGNLAQAYVNPQAGAEMGQRIASQVAQHPAETVGNVIGVVAGGELLGEGVNVARAALPVGGKVVGRVALLGKTPEAAYESALKPSTMLSAGDRASVIQTGLDQGIPVSKGGLEKIGGRIDALNQAIKDQIAADPTRQISPVPALQNLRSVRAKFANQVNPAADVNAVNAAGNEFADNFGPNGNYPQGTMPADAAQAMKQGTYRALGNKAYGELKGASIEAQKALARGLKEEIANQFPEINNLNAQESKLLDLEPVIERAVNRTANHQLIGIGSPIAGTAIKATTGSTSAGAVAMALKAVLDNPMVKSRLAIAVSRAQKIPFSQASGRVAAYAEALGASAGATRAIQGDQIADQTP